VTPSWGDSGFKLEPKSREERRPTWPRVAVLAGVLVLAFVVSRAAQNDEQVTQERAVEIAMEQIDFDPTYTQVRFLRQGINRQPFWFVSLSIPIGFSGDRADLFRRLAVVQINSESGEVESVKEQSPEDNRQNIQEAKERDQDAEVQAKLDEFSNEPQTSGEEP
jgi:hypothetical protein